MGGRDHRRTNLFRVVVIAHLLFTVSCQREQRQFEPPSPSTNTLTITMSDLRPGATAPDVAINNPAEATAYSVSEGKRLFTAYNCAGCHFNGGGGIGPPLMDEKWIYGSQPANVYATIVEGRPNGMPSFRNKIPDQQVWELAAYVRSMSGLLRKDISPGRNDDLMPHKSEQALEKKPPQNSGLPASAQHP